MMETLPVEIRRMIMEHFSNTELLRISLVSKLFKNEARSLMSARGTLNADLGVACRNVLPFASDLKGMDIVPFSGIKIMWSSEEHRKLCSPRPILKQAPTLDVLDRVLWKRLSINMHGSRSVPKKCPAFQLVRKVLTEFSEVLEQLELNNHPKLLRFIGETIQGSRFPRLKILKIVGSAQGDGIRIERNFLKEIVDRAPNLHEFHQDRCPDLSENVLEGSSAVLVSSCDTYNPILHEFSEGYNGTVKLKEINMYYTDSFSMRRFNRTVPRILQSSCDTLHSLTINLAFLLPLMRSGVRLERLTGFGTYLDYARWESMDPRIFLLLKQFDFARVIPKLNRVKVCVDSCYDRISANHMTELVEQAIAGARTQEPAADRVVNIKRISFFESLTPKAVPFLAGIFPNVETIATTVSRGGQQIPYGLLWNHWPELKELQVEKFSSFTERSGGTRNENLDSVFCGIFPAEVARLRKQDEEYLRAVHIVPVMPSMTCLRGLRALKIVRRHYNPLGVPCKDMDSMFSKVTALVAFQRCPDLSVAIETNSREMFEALDHLGPYAAVELVH